MSQTKFYSKNTQNIDQLIPTLQTKIQDTNTRIILKNLVYLIGLPKNLADQEVYNLKKILTQEAFLGQYGNILKVVFKSQVFNVNGEEQFSCYITFSEQREAALAVIALQDFKYSGCNLKASFGTSKYCSFFIRNVPCTNQMCVFQHSIAKPEDTFTSIQIQSKNVSQMHYDWAVSILRQYKKDIKIEKPQKRKNHMFPGLGLMMEIIRSPQIKSLKKKPICSQNYSPLKCSRKSSNNDNETQNDSFDFEKEDIFSDLIDQKIIQNCLSPLKYQKKSLLPFVQNDEPQSTSIQEIIQSILKGNQTDARFRFLSMQNCNY